MGEPIKRPLNTKHRELMRALAIGMSQREAAQRCGFTESRVSILKKSELFMAELEKITAEIREKTTTKAAEAFTNARYQEQLDKMAPKALETIEDMMNPEHKDVHRLKAADLALSKNPKLQLTERTQTQTIVIERDSGIANVLRRLELEDAPDEDLIELAKDSEDGDSLTEEA